jgi:hypothetical protein
MSGDPRDAVISEFADQYAVLAAENDELLRGKQIAEMETHMLRECLDTYRLMLAESMTLGHAQNERIIQLTEFLRREREHNRDLRAAVVMGTQTTSRRVEIVVPPLVTSDIASPQPPMIQ